MMELPEVFIESVHGHFLAGRLAAIDSIGYCFRHNFHGDMDYTDVGGGCPLLRFCFRSGSLHR